MDFKDMTDNFMDDDQYFNFVIPVGVGLIAAKKIKKARLSKEEKSWSIKFPMTEDLKKLENNLILAKRKLNLLPSNTGKDRISKSALETYIQKLEKYKEDLLKAIEEEDLKQKKEQENKIKEEEEKKAKEEAEKKEKEEIERQKLETNNKNSSLSNDKKPKTLLYIGIGVGVLVVGVVLFMALKNKKS